MDTKELKVFKVLVGWGQRSCGYQSRKKMQVLAAIADLQRFDMKNVKYWRQVRKRGGFADANLLKCLSMCGKGGMGSFD